MEHRDIQLLKKIMSECKDIIRYTNEVGKKGSLKMMFIRRQQLCHFLT